MNTSDIQTLIDYHYWANQRILDQAARLTQEQYTAPANVPFGSLRGTLVHLLSAERTWRMRCQEGISPSAMLSETGYATFDQLISLWREEESAMRAYIRTLSEADLEKPIRYTNTKGATLEVRLSHILTHVVNHGTQHRSEAAILLTDFGHSPGDLDFIYFSLAQQPTGARPS